MYMYSGGWPVGATSDQIRAGYVTNGGHPQSTGFGQNYGGTTNNLERHDTGVCGESDNGLGDADASGTKTNQCFGGISAGAGGATSTMGKHITGWGAALQICQNVGARLCTVEELLAENTRNTGCNHDCQMVWSSQMHTTCGADHHVAAQGGLNCAYMICKRHRISTLSPWGTSERLLAMTGPDECSEAEYRQGSSGQDTSCQCTPRCSPDLTSHAVRCCADVFFEAGTPGVSVDLTAGLPKGGCHFGKSHTQFVAA